MNGSEPKRDPTVPLRKLVPNLFTSAALCAGIASMHFVAKAEPDFARAVAAIGISAVLDMLDGRAARLLKGSSRFGETFDSLSDFVSFGIAPAFLLYRFCQPNMTLWGLSLEGPLLVAMVLFVLCSAFRLARFTALQRRKKVGAKPSRFFMGMPTPAAAGAALVPLMLMLSDLGVRMPTALVIGHTLLIAAMMASRWPMFSFKRIRVARAWITPMMLAVGLLVVLAVRDAWLTAAVLSLGYMLSLPLSRAMAVREAAEGIGTGPASGKAGVVEAPGL